VIFNSLTYLLFLALAVILYWLLPQRPRLGMLFIASLLFYGFWRVEYLPLMLISAINDYVASLKIYRSDNPRVRKSWLILSLIVNLGLLFYFKYLIFFVDNAVGLAHLLGIEISAPALEIILPLGISFYTFQTMSYTIDVYRGFIVPETDFVLYNCYVTYFPQLVAGPILRANEVIPWLRERAPFRSSDLSHGIRRVAYGLFLKVVLADNLAPIVDAGYAQNVSSMSAWDIWTLAFLFGFQIYFDFSAYSHIALGSARMMGIVFPENFNFPYIASSPRDFWRRWHISLSSWIRDYLYLPLAGSRVRDTSVGGLATATEPAGSERKTFALFLTWGIMGLWHGAAWAFVFWGLYHATLVYFYRLLSPLFKKVPSRLARLGGWAITLPLAMLSWIPFRAIDLQKTFAMYAKLFQPREYLWLGLRENDYLVAATMLVATIIAHWTTQFVVPRLARRPILRFVLDTTSLTVIFLLVFIFLRPLVQFIYFQF
jgi:D-alanyl-lipoteichoic acid acyltransferase DltB (MBOAT superfamily)